jgi:hypothetical protein
MYEFENGSVPNIQIYFVIEVVTNDGFQRIENLGWDKYSISSLRRINKKDNDFSFKKVEILWRSGGLAQTINDVHMYQKRTNSDISRVRIIFFLNQKTYELDISVTSCIDFILFQVLAFSSRDG